ncbi:MAG: hypothetical protein AAFQ28_04920 [Pseudomonadota bacterium]
MTDNPSLEDLLTPAEASQIVRRSASSLAKDRHFSIQNGKLKGPRWVNLSGRIYYTRKALDDYIREQIASSPFAETVG